MHAAGLSAVSGFLFAYGYMESICHICVIGQVVKIWVLGFMLTNLYSVEAQLSARMIQVTSFSSVGQDCSGNTTHDTCATLNHEY